MKACSPHVVTVGDKVRYLRLHIDKGAAGLWEWKSIKLLFIMKNDL